MKDAIIVGDSLDFPRRVPAYPATDGYTLKYRLAPLTAGAGSVIELTASAYGSDYRIQAAPTTTGAWTAGEYSAFAWVEKTGEQHTVYPTLLDGTPAPALCTIYPDPRTVEAYDGRSTAQKQLASIEAALEAFAYGVEEYEINGRRWRRDQIANLEAQAAKLRGRVWREEIAERMAQGGANARMIGVRFGRA